MQKNLQNSPRLLYKIIPSGNTQDMFCKATPETKSHGV